MKKSMKKVDKIVTWLIIGWAVASIFWVAAHTKKWKEVTEEVKDTGKKVAKKWVALFWRALVKAIDLFDSKKK